MKKITLYNVGQKPELIGRTKNGFPLVIHPGKTVSVNEDVALELLKKKNIVDKSEVKEEATKKSKIKQDK